MNLYVDDYQKIIASAFENIISYSFLDKGYKNRLRIVDEVNHQSVIRSKAINIRDYAGAALLEEKKTVLYYGIRVIQEYLKEGVLEEKDLNKLTSELLDAIYKKKEILKKLYVQSDYTIISEYMERSEFVEEDGRICLCLSNSDIMMSRMNKSNREFVTIIDTLRSQ